MFFSPGGTSWAESFFAVWGAVGKSSFCCLTWSSGLGVWVWVWVWVSCLVAVMALAVFRVPFSQVTITGTKAFMEAIMGTSDLVGPPLPLSSFLSKAVHLVTWPVSAA